jgi:ATP-binding cassette subfamily B protein
MKKRKNELFHMLTGFAKGSKRYFFVAVLGTALSILFSFLIPQVVGFTVDSVIGDKSGPLTGLLTPLFGEAGGRDFLRANLIFCGLAVVACACLSGIFTFMARMGTTKGTERFVKKLRDTLFAHTQRLPFSWHTKNQTGDVIQRCTYDVDTAQRFIAQQLIEVVRTVILVAFALAFMFSMNVLLAVIALLFIPLILGYSRFFFSRIGDKFREADEAEGELLIHVQENLTGVRVVRAFGREKFETDRFDEKNETYIGKWLTLGNLLGWFWGMGDVASSGELLVMVAVGSVLAASGTLTLGEFLVFISYTLTMAWPVRALGRIISEMSKTGVSLRRIKEILDAPAEAEEPGALTPAMDGDIVFDRVSFAYDADDKAPEEQPALRNAEEKSAAKMTQPVLADLSFTIKSGTTFGILGTTGSGKSTVTYLLNRLYDLEEDQGSISIGGVDIRKIDRSYLRRNIGLVLQEPFLFSKTIFENIDIAARSSDLNRVRRTAAMAAVDDSIQSFSGGYDTVVGERGVTLSGGQKQRVAIARTLMLDAPIMVFDDSMSSLDMETDAKIRASLRENTRGATVILISHRISTLMLSDQIMVLDNGRLAEVGSHAELLEKNGIYKRIYDLQSGT